VIVALVYYVINSSSKPIKPASTKSTVEIFREARKQEAIQENDDRFPLTILFGTQSGTSEKLAVLLKKEALQKNFRVKLLDLENYKEDDLEKEKMVIILISTYGEGDPPDAARPFYEWLMSESHSDDELSKVNYTVFGLGNKTYDHFNKMAKDFDTRLSAMGAHCVYPTGEGDDDGCLDDDFSSWKSGLWVAIGEHFSLKNLSELGSAGYVRDTKLILHDSSFELPKTSSGKKVDQKTPFISTIKSTRELHTSNSDRSCLDIEFELNEQFSYLPGDHLGVYPENSSDLVKRLASRLEVDLNQKFSLVSVENSETVVMGPCTIQHALSRLCDITSLPGKNLLKNLSEYATDPQEKEFLLKISSTTKEPPSWESWIKQDLRNIVEVMEDMKSVKIPFDLLLELLPRLAPRYYSISSSRKLKPSSVHITAVHVRYEKPTGRVHDGVCTTFLREKHLSRESEEKTSDFSAPIFVRKSNFHLPSNPKVPVIMVGPGTGIAPFCGFIQERKSKVREAAEGTEFGDFVLFFGCRERCTDFIYQQELENAVQEKVLSHLFVAFSRESSEKVYVQHKIKEQGKLIWDLIDRKGAYIYVCGDANKMAKDVSSTLHAISVEHGNLTPQQSKAYWHSLQNCGRYLQDVWV